jgi:tetratricopeptide (TPR) repeat protein
MTRFLVVLTTLLFASSALAAPSDPSRETQELAGTTAPQELKDLFYGEALYHAFQGDWFDSIARLDTELGQFHGLDEPELDSLFPHVHQAEFAVGDFELAYRMHQRAGRAISAVIEGKVEEPVRNRAIYRLARLYFRKEQPVNALHALERIKGEVPADLRDHLAFLRAQILMTNGRPAEAALILRELQGAEDYEGFATYNLGIALMRDGHPLEGRQYLDRSGRIDSAVPATLAIKDKSNLVLGEKLLEEDLFEGAKLVLDRVRLSGSFSNRALLGSGWADAFQDRFERALVPWTILSEREITDSAVQEALLAVPYAYGKLGVYSKAALLYGRALQAFGTEVDKLGASIGSIREGRFLQALVREELKQDANWVVKLRNLPDTPETYYLLDLMASHDFQESLKNYLDLEELRKKLVVWEGDLSAFEEIIRLRRAYYQPLLPQIDRHFRQLDSQMRLRLEQRDHVEKRLQALLTAPRPDSLATGEERILKEQISRMEQALTADGEVASGEFGARIRRLRGVLDWKIHTDYDRRLTEAHHHLHDLNRHIDALQKQYSAFVRVRQAATQSYQGYDGVIRRQRHRIGEARETVTTLMARQGHILEEMAVNELSSRRERLAEYQIKARFSLADSYDRAARAEGLKKVEP